MVIVMSAIRIGVIRMKNKEKYAKEIVDIACKREPLAIAKSTGLPVSCTTLACDECLFDSVSSCQDGIKEWAESEYVERPVISKSDRTFLDYIRDEDKYIVRDENGELFIYESRPRKVNACWNAVSLTYERYLHLNRHFNVDFPMIKWLDEEPWLIEDLKKLEVVENYE